MGSTTTTVPVVTMPPATVNPPPPRHAIASLLTQDTIENIVYGIMEKQQLPAPVLKKPHTKKCLFCGQPKSKYEHDRSSIHNLYQQGPLRTLWTQSSSRGSWRPLGREWRTSRSRRAEESPAPGRKCRFCKLELRQGPNSPHIHTGFPGVPGKYIYCKLTGIRKSLHVFLL